MLCDEFLVRHDALCALADDLAARGDFARAEAVNLEVMEMDFALHPEIETVDLGDRPS